MDECKPLGDGPARASCGPAAAGSGTAAAGGPR